ncbi:MAG: MarR family transcriptional regulator [Bacteroidales bacterium]|nr:MarR family transcriptional regulator [Bacteroidales bacterium]
MENADKVLNVLKKSGRELRTGEIVDQSGLEKKEVDNIIKILKTKGKIFSSKRCFWQANPE